LPRSALASGFEDNNSNQGKLTERDGSVQLTSSIRKLVL
jgi:hypothetical protein